MLNSNGTLKTGRICIRFENWVLRPQSAKDLAFGCERKRPRWPGKNSTFGKTLGHIVEFKEVLGAYLSGDEGEVVKGKNGE